MSKTDKTAPWWVRSANRPEFLEEWHDHAGRDCDLPEVRAVTDRDIYPPRTGCAWVVSMTFWCEHENWCGCPGCSDTRGRKIKARRARYAGRRAPRTWQDEY